MAPYIILAIIMFGLLIAVHEFGHFITAKLLGVRVNEFAIGMGPKLFQKKKGETEYTLRAFPVGGFCAMEGEESDSGDPKAFYSKAAWRKLIILLAGSFMNFVTGILIILVLFSQASAFRVPVITGLMDGFQLEGESGIMLGDEIYSIDGNRIYLYSDVSLYLNRTNGTDMDLVLIRDGEKVVLEDFPLTVQEYTYQGQQAMMFGLEFNQLEDATFGSYLKMSWYQAVDYVRTVWLSLGDLVGGAVGFQDLSGPIGIVGMVGEVGAQAETASEGLQDVMNFMAFIAINLAVMNLLPIPALDGGRIFFLLVGSVITLITKKKIDPKYEGYINFACFALLLGLMAMVAVNDVIKLVFV